MNAKLNSGRRRRITLSLLGSGVGGVGHWLVDHFFLLAVVFAHFQGLAASGVLLLDHPVEHEVVLVSHAVEEILEELAEVADVGLLFEL